MIPSHVSPASFIGIMLIKQMIFAIVIHHAIGVVCPATSGGIVQLWAIFLFVQVIVTHDGICLKNLIYSTYIFGKNKLEFLTLVGRNIEKSPIIYGVFSHPNIIVGQLFCIHNEVHSLSVKRTLNWYIQILLLDLECSFCLCT